MSKGKVIVTGGGGYIGSHTLIDLIESGWEVVSIDNHCRSNPLILKGVESITGQSIQNHVIDLKNREDTLQIIKEHDDALGIIHFAALKSVPESVEKPKLYFENNMGSLENLLDSIKQTGIPNFVFSSSCSVYGNAKEVPVTETTPFQKAESPYAETKLLGEQMINDFAKANSSFKFVHLRYFNPIGAHDSAKIGELSIDVPNNLVPYITQTAIGKLPKLIIYGNNYPTRDGTCIRDYIHVMDIAHAHTLAMSWLCRQEKLGEPAIFNLGTGNGVSVKEAIDSFISVTGENLNYEFGPKREGDVVAVYADNKKAKSILDWNPSRSLDDMMRSAWAWEKYMKKMELIGIDWYSSKN